MTSIYNQYEATTKKMKEQFGEDIDQSRISGFHDHIIICNWNPKAEQIIRELHADNVRIPKPIIIITDQPQEVTQSTEAWMKEVFVIPGSPLDNRVLEKASLNTAGTAIILSDPREGKFADAKTIVIALAVEAINRRVHTVVEILESQNKKHFQNTHVDEIVCVEEMTEKILAQAALTHHISHLYLHLLTQSSATNEVYNIPVPEKYIGRTYAELEKTLMNYDEEPVILVGFETREEFGINQWSNPILKHRLYLNPKKHPKEREKGKNHKFIKGDEIMVIAYNMPNLEKLE